MKKIISKLLLIVILIFTFYYGASIAFFDIKTKDAKTVGTATDIVVTPITNFVAGNPAYDKIQKFPIDDYVFNSSVDFFCAQHGTPYADSNTNTTLGDSENYHIINYITKHKHTGYTKGSMSTYSSDMDGDLDTSADFYVYIDDEGNFKLHEPATYTYYGYCDESEKSAPPTYTVYTNWIYKSKEEDFGCETGCSGEGADEVKVKLAFLMATYKSGGTDGTPENGMDKQNNVYKRGSYSSDPLQTSVWSTKSSGWINGGNEAENDLEVQAQAYWDYHEASVNPQVDVTPDDNVGTVLMSDGSYKIGPFKMGAYVRAKDYDCYKSDGTPQTLQDIFGETKGDIIKIEAVLAGEGGASSPIDITNKIISNSGTAIEIEPNLSFYINLSEGDIGGCDELKEIRFTYQRIHVYGKGTKYTGDQKLLTFKMKAGSEKDGETYNGGCSLYNCTVCKHTNLGWNERSAKPATHAYWCLDSSYCENGSSASSFASDAEIPSGCSAEFEELGTYCGHIHYTWFSKDVPGCYKSKPVYKCTKFGCFPTSDTVHSVAECTGTITLDHYIAGDLDCSHTCSYDDGCEKKHKCTTEYCVHGHEGGIHGNTTPSCTGCTPTSTASHGDSECTGTLSSNCSTCKSWGADHVDACSATTVCEHGHASCYKFEWQRSPTDDVDKCQDGFAGGAWLDVEVKRYDITVSVPLKTNIKIYKYITNVDHIEAGGRDITVDDRSSKTKAEKEADTVKIERGDKVTYLIKLVNASRFDTAVKVNDILPNEISNENFNPNKPGYGTVHLAEWIEVPAKGETTITVTLEAQAKTGTHENRVEIITTNDGPQHMRFVLWGEDATHGERGYDDGDNQTNIVNEDESQLTDSDYYTIKEYDISVDKYITKVEHANGTVTYEDETSRKNIDDETIKENNPVTIESGDIVTYTIDLYNTTNSYLSNSAKDRNEEPFWDPDIVYVTLNDVLPTGGTIKGIEVSTGGTYTSFPMKEIKVLPDSVTKIKVKVEVVQNSKEGTESDASKFVNVDEQYFVGGTTRAALRVEKNTAKVDSENILNVNKLEIKNNPSKEESSDWVLLKEYSVSLDKYITEIKHKTNGVKTFDSTDRKQKDEEETQKKANALYAEFGDVVTYKIDIYNTTAPYCTGDSSADPYYDPDLVYVNVQDTLPNKYSELTVETSNSTGTIKTTTGGFKIEDIMVPKNGKTTITVTIVVEEHTRETLEENNIKIIDVVKNINKKTVVVHSKKHSTSDWYKINDYALTLNKYIKKYNEEKTKENNENNFTSETNTIADRYEMTEAEKAVAPVQVEKTETLIYHIRLTNDSVAAGNKFATQVRPTVIKDAMDNGLKYKSVEVNIYDSSNNVKFADIPTTHKEEANNTHVFTIEDKYGSGGDYLILDPSDYIVYAITVEVTKTNMFLFNLENTGSMVTLTNINRSISSTEDEETNATREIKNDSYNENIATQQTSTEYVKLKDLVIAGKVWLDNDKDGYIGQAKSGVLEVGGSAIDVEINPSTNIEDSEGKEYAMKGIPVKLYKVESGATTGTLLKTTKTDENGLFTFARNDTLAYYPTNSYAATKAGVVESEQRIDKATGKDNNKNYTEESQLINYYIEYEYDGLTYKSTEIYSDNTNIGINGDINDDYKIDSNAYEFKDVRAEYNKVYEIIAFNKAYDGNIANANDLSYEKAGHESFIREDTGRPMKARSFIDLGKNESIENTKLLWLLKQTTEDDKPETEYLKYINLGLEEREDVDMSITQDVYEVKTTINGEQMIYEYNQNNYTLQKGEVTSDNVNNPEANPKAIDKKQSSTNSNEFDSERFFTGYTSDSSTTMKLYDFEYYLEDYNYRISQYHIDTIRDYKGSTARDYTKDVIDSGNSVILDNAGSAMAISGATVDSRETGRESELNTEITFRIKVTNNSIPNDEPYKEDPDKKIYTGVNEIVEYYDNSFVNVIDGSFFVKTKDDNGYLVNTEMKVMKAKAYLQDGSEQDVELSSSSLYNTPRTIDGFSTLFIRPASTGTTKAGDFIIGEGESMDILITFVVEKEPENPNTKEMETILGNKIAIAEISAYSTYYLDEGAYTPASLIDKDSNPGNFGEAYGGTTEANSEAYAQYIEDDTFKTGITTKVLNENDFVSIYNVERTLTGFVWDDARSNTASDSNGVQYIGDGTYDTSINADANARKNQVFNIMNGNTIVGNKENNDFRVEDVKVELVEQVRMPDSFSPTGEKIYEDTIFANGETDVNASVMRTRTDANGEYKFVGYVPGEYIVKFTYGDKEEGESANSLSDNRLIFNGQDYKSTTYQAKESAYADNITDMDTKLAVLEKAGNSDAKDDEIRRLEVISFSEIMNNERNEILKGKNSINKDALLSNTYMFSETTDFLVRIEKETQDVTVLTYEQHNKKITELTINARFAIHNIDFGLQYRPELQVALNKYISNIQVITSDSSGANVTEPIIDAIFDEYYGVVTGTDMLTGATSFISNAEGVVIKVNPNDTDAQIQSTITAAGGDISKAKKDANGSYTLAIAGTTLNEEKSIGLHNVQYLPNSYSKTSDGSLDVRFEDGKYRIQATQGFAYVVVDDEIMQGATIKVKYLFTGTNASEIDRVSENLSKLRFKENYEVVEKYSKYSDSSNPYYGEIIYQTSAPSEKPSFFDTVYSAAKTARNALFSEFYHYELDGLNSIKKDDLGRDIRYRIKDKSMEVNGKVINIPNINNKTETSGTPHTGNTGYYGRYLGSTYYTGEINSNKEVVAELKLDKILDYIDNDLVFNDIDNKDENRLWKTTTSSELYTGQTSLNPDFKFARMLNPDLFTYYDSNGNVTTDPTGTPRLLDGKGRSYDTAERSNLALSLDDRVRDDYGAYATAANTDADPTVNKEFSKFLLPRDSESLKSFGTISLTAAKVLSPEDDTDDMVYENVAEIIQYTSVTGRVTNLATTLGNAKIEHITSESPEFREGRTESDTASVEKVTLTPPTGLNRVNTIVKNVVESASYTVFIIIGAIAVCVMVIIGINIYHAKKRIK